MRHKVFASIAAVFVAAVLAGCAVSPGAGRRSCADCHQKDMERYSAGPLHKPVADKDCESCHVPHGLIGALRLRLHDGALCYKCHEKDRVRLEKAHLHTPI
ncbi:MAG: cytochrome c3 family protein, partial [Deltaproteobacteria bacterium]